ncbi:hypothetical protein AMECASPLE_027208 [Ameca splendens]|uniref:Uncharacterized protein n=1 Tax=Ameca splendens TaxID=208324 RepID=A0ABV1ACV6_9TELE
MQLLTLQFCNLKLCGHHKPGDPPFSLDVTPTKKQNSTGLTWSVGQTDRSLAMEALYRGQLSSLPSGWMSHELCLNSGIELRFRRGACLWYICVSELIPLILCTACLHPEPKERDQLLHILFNLIKRPDDEQRQMILTGCVAFARHVGPTRVEAELLPQCWEQINHKYPERRLLVAEACGALAPYLPKEIRSSLVLSMLQQMLAEDKADMVREAVVKSLGIIMGYIDDSDKYAQGFELMLLSLGDPSERVVNAVHQVFIPAFSAWTTELGTLHTALIPSLLSRIEKLLTQGEHGLDEHKLHVFLSALQSLIPPLFAVVLQNAPFTSRVKLHEDIPAIEVTRFPRPASPLQDMAIIIGSRELLSSLLLLYDHQLEHEGTTGWESLLWVVNQLLPQLIEIVGRINVTSSTCVHEFSRFFWRFCRTFGKIFTNTKVKLSHLLCLTIMLCLRGHDKQS